MTNGEGLNIESTPASRWAARYRKRYGYNFYGMITFLGFVTIFFNFFIGIGIMGIGGYLIKKHYEHHKNL